MLRRIPVWPASYAGTSIPVWRLLKWRTRNWKWNHASVTLKTTGKGTARLHAPQRHWGQTCHEAWNGHYPNPFHFQTEFLSTTRYLPESPLLDKHISLFLANIDTQGNRRDVFPWRGRHSASSGICLSAKYCSTVQGHAPLDKHGRIAKQIGGNVIAIDCVFLDGFEDKVPLQHPVIRSYCAWEAGRLSWAYHVGLYPN